METRSFRLGRHGLALAVALAFLYFGRAVTETFMVPCLVYAVPQSWLPLATIQSREGYLLAWFGVLWPFLFLAPSAAFAESRIFRTPTASHLLLGALAMGVFHGTLTAAISLLLWRWPLDNLLRSSYNALASIAYWITSLGLAALAGRCRKADTSG